MTMLASFDLRGHRPFAVTFTANSAAELMDSWGDLVNLFKEIDPDVESVCYPIKAGGLSSTESLATDGGS